MFLDALVDQFLAQLQRRGVSVLAIRRIKIAIAVEIDKAHTAGELVLDPTPMPSSDTPTRDETPKGASSRSMPAVRVPPPRLPDDDD